MTPPRPLGEKERIIFRREWVMKQKRDFKSLDEITQEWAATYPDQAVHRSTIANDIKASLKRSVAETDLATVEWRMLHMARIEKALANKPFQKKMEEADLFAYDRFDKMMDKLIKLSGAYAPTKVAQTDTAGQDVTSLSEEERRDRIQRFMDIAAQRKEDAALEDDLGA